MRLYYSDSLVTLYHGDFRELPVEQYDCAIADPPYNETSLDWDVWPDGWLEHAARLTRSLWLFGSLRVFLSHAAEVAAWRFAQDVIWEKHNGTNMHADRFRRVHEIAAHFYRGEWTSLYREPQRTLDATKRSLRRKHKPQHWGGIGPHAYDSEDGGPRLARSVQRFRSCHGSADNETQKPVDLVKLLIAYSCPPGGIVLSPFAGSGTDLVAAKALGRRAVGVELREDQCRKAAARLAQGELALAEAKSTRHPKPELHLGETFGAPDPEFADAVLPYVFGESLGAQTSEERRLLPQVVKGPARHQHRRPAPRAARAREVPRPVDRR